VDKRLPDDPSLAWDYLAEFLIALGVCVVAWSLLGAPGC
jgi:hypothetical protein